jgi:hydrogenase-4 component F
MPLQGGLWLAGGLAILGTPPSGLFFTEFAILGVALRSHAVVVTVLYLLLLFVIFCGMVRVFLGMACGDAPADAPTAAPAPDSPWTSLPPLVLILCALALGLYVPEPLLALLRHAAALLGGTP